MQIAEKVTCNIFVDQTFTPHMQSAKKSTEGRKSSSNKKIYGKVTIVGDQQQANLSIDIWKKAFKDASEKLCPVRACGHECGCLPVLARLVISLVCSVITGSVLVDPDLF